MFGLRRAASSLCWRTLLVAKTGILKQTFQNTTQALQSWIEVSQEKERCIDYQVLEVGSRLDVYGTAAMVNFCKPLPPIR